MGSINLDSATGSIYLPNPLQIGGSVYIRNNSLLQSLIIDTQFIAGEFVVQNASALTTLLMMNLNTIEEIVLQDVPLLSSWGEPNATVISSMAVEDTMLRDIALQYVETIDEIRITNNPNLSSVDFPSVKNVTNYFFVRENNPSIYITLDELQWANNISWRDVGDVDLPRLDKINFTLEIGDSSVGTIYLPKLAYADGLYFQNNENLTYIGAPDLNSLGDQGITIVNNSKLASPGNFSALQKASGIELSGDFTE
jgi:hypothetical protein